MSAPHILLLFSPTPQTITQDQSIPSGEEFGIPQVLRERPPGEGAGGGFLLSLQPVRVVLPAEVEFIRHEWVRLHGSVRYEKRPKPPIPVQHTVEAVVPFARTVRVFRAGVRQPARLLVKARREDEELLLLL